MDFVSQLSRDGQTAWVANEQSGSLSVIDLNRRRVAKVIEMGGGTRGLALHPTQPVLYVHNRLSDTLSVIDTASATELTEMPIATWDPMPELIREGRKFLYDAKLAGNGTTHTTSRTLSIRPCPSARRLSHSRCSRWSAARSMRLSSRVTAMGRNCRQAKNGGDS